MLVSGYSPRCCCKARVATDSAALQLGFRVFITDRTCKKDERKRGAASRHTCHIRKYQHNTGKFRSDLRQLVMPVCYSVFSSSFFVKMLKIYLPCSLINVPPCYLYMWKLVTVPYLFTLAPLWLCMKMQIQVIVSTCISLLCLDRGNQ